LDFEVTPLVSAGNLMLLSRMTSSRTTGYILNIDLPRSNLAESPDWPILFANLIELRRENLPGLIRRNYRLGEEIRFRLFEGDFDPHAGLELSLEHAGQSRPIVRRPVIDLSPPDETGVFEIRQGSAPLDRFAVNFFDAEESNLRQLAAGHRQPKGSP